MILPASVSRSLMSCPAGNEQQQLFPLYNTLSGDSFAPALCVSNDRHIVGHELIRFVSLNSHITVALPSSTLNPTFSLCRRTSRPISTGWKLLSRLIARNVKARSVWHATKLVEPRLVNLCLRMPVSSLGRGKAKQMTALQSLQTSSCIARTCRL